MTKKEIEKEKNSMGEIEFYQYFFGGYDSDFIEEYIDQFRESEEILYLIYNLLKNNKQYNVELFEGSLSIENKKTKEYYKLTLEF